ncbi:MAG: DegT/DnrJ/EryC1/StrS family aminotransferase [Cyanobacteria bacterium P01_H01_bin.150]
MTSEFSDRNTSTKWLAKFYGKTTGGLVNSGAAAIDLALHYLGIQRGASVAIPDNCCYLVPEAILRFGCVPLLVPVGDDLMLTPNRVACALSKKVKAIIAIHQWGLPCDILALRQLVGTQIPIIEDAAQAWRLKARGQEIGMHSDVVVTSFGDRKPVSIGEGGAAFANSETITKIIDRWSPNQCSRSLPHLPIALSQYAFPHLSEAIHLADKLIKTRRAFVAQALPILQHQYGLRVWTPAVGDEPYWYYLPVWMETEDLAQRGRNSCYADTLDICRPRPVSLKDVSLFKGKIEVAFASENKACQIPCLLIGTSGGCSTISVLKAWLRDVFTS